MKHYLTDYDGAIRIVHVKDEDVPHFLELYRELVVAVADTLPELLNSPEWLLWVRIQMLKQEE
jgi:hypothetical protein